MAETIIKYNVPKTANRGGQIIVNANNVYGSNGGGGNIQSDETVDNSKWRDSTGSQSLVPKASENTADGVNSIAIGTDTQTTNEGELAIGRYNSSTEGKTFFSIGDGGDDENRHNIFEVTNTTVKASSYSGKNATLTEKIAAPTISGTNATIEKNVKADSGSFNTITSNTVTVNNKLKTNQLEAVSGYIKTLLSNEITVDYLTVTKAAHFFKLIIDEIKSAQGQLIITPSNAVIDKVETVNGNYRCYYRSSDKNGNRIYNTFEANDQVVCQTFNAATGTSYNVSNTYYWRLVTGTGTTETDISGETVECHYLDLSDTDKDQYSISAPKAGDNVVQLGSRTDSTRQSAIIISAYNTPFLDKGLKAPSIVQYAGINDYDLSKHRLNIISDGFNNFKGGYTTNNGEDIENLISTGDKALENKITTANSNINSLIDSLNSVSGVVSSHTQSISNIEQTNAKIQSTVSANTQSIGNLSNDVKTVSGTVTGYSTAISNLQQTADGLQSTVENHSNSIIQLNGNIASQNDTINNLSGKVNTNTSNISSLQQTATGLTSTVSEHTKQITNINGTVNTISEQVETNTENVSKIEQTANGIAMSVSQKLKKYDGLYSPNMLTGLIDGDEWILNNGDGTTRPATFDDSYPRFYFYENITDMFSPYIQLTKGTYVFSANVKEQFRPKSNIYIRMKSTSDEYPWSSPEITSNNLGTYDKIEWMDDDYSITVNSITYRRQYIVFTVNDDGEYIINFKGNKDSSDVVKPKLEYGDTPTDYDESNSHVYSNIKQTADNIQLNVYDELKEKTGIDISNGKITLDADNTDFTGNINLFNPDDGITIFDEYKNPRISIQNERLNNLTDYSFGSNVRYFGTTTGVSHSNTVAITYPAISMGQFTAGQTAKFNEIYLSFATNWDNSSALHYNKVDSVTYNYTIKYGETIVRIVENTIQSVSDSSTIKLQDYTNNNLPYTGEYKLYVTATFRLKEPPKSYRTTASIKVMKITPNLSKVGLDGAIFSTSQSQYNWFGSDQTLLRNGKSCIRLKNGHLERNTYNPQTTTTDGYWGDISTTMPYTVVTSTSYTASLNDGMVFFYGTTNTSARRVLTLPTPSRCPGKVIYVKNGVNHNTIVQSEDGSNCFMECNVTSVQSNVQVGHNAVFFISVGGLWLNFWCVP